MGLRHAEDARLGNPAVGTTRGQGDLIPRETLRSAQKKIRLRTTAYTNSHTFKAQALHLGYFFDSLQQYFEGGINTLPLDSRRM